MLRPADPAASAPIISATPTPTPSATPSPTPTPTGYPADAGAYDVATLRQVNVFAVIAALPVAYLPRDYAYGGTTMPIIERQPNWVHVLLVGRQAVPSQGDPAQVTGWLRTQDVDVTTQEASVQVSISARTIDIVRGGGPERIATDFGWGADSTTPHGRSFIMTIRTEPSFLYTRGHPLVYLPVQSPTMDGFAGAGVAVTAFHYHDERSGNVSNGCLRVDPTAISRLAELPPGAAVTIRP